MTVTCRCSGPSSRVASEGVRNAPSWVFLSNEANGGLVLETVVTAFHENTDLSENLSLKARREGRAKLNLKNLSSLPISNHCELPWRTQKIKWGTHCPSIRYGIKISQIEKKTIFYQETDYWHLLRFSKVPPESPGMSSCWVLYLFELCL